MTAASSCGRCKRNTHLLAHGSETLCRTCYEGHVPPWQRRISFSEECDSIASVNGSGHAGRRQMLLGALWAVGGLAITGATYLSAEPGGSFVMAWGAVAYGLFEIGRGALKYW